MFFPDHEKFKSLCERSDHFQVLTGVACCSDPLFLWPRATVFSRQVVGFAEPTSGGLPAIWILPFWKLDLLAWSWMLLGFLLRILKALFSGWFDVRFQLKCSKCPFVTDQVNCGQESSKIQHGAQAMLYLIRSYLIQIAESFKGDASRIIIGFVWKCRTPKSTGDIWFLSSFPYIVPIYMAIRCYICI